MSNISAVLFDLDGLLADTEDLHVKAYSLAFEEFGITLTDEEIYRGMGVPTRDNVVRIMNDHGIPQKRFAKMIELRYDAYYSLTQSTPISFMEGAVDLLQLVKEKGLKRALVTSSIKEHGMAVLSNLQKQIKSALRLDGYFDVKVFGDEITDNKPEPEIYLKAVERLNLEPFRCLALEDSETGVVSAKRAGINVFAVPNKYSVGQNFDRADRVIPSLGEIVRSGLIG
ncbi:MAG TPA: HAD family phosphatase [Spirochaetota bacterium]|nr:HAD family phosphatase [Spirochaetota bacterium]